MGREELDKTTGKRRGFWERLGDGLRGARIGYLLGRAHLHDATIAPQSISTPQPTTEMAQRAFSRFGVDPSVGRDDLVELLANGLDGTWHCARVWDRATAVSSRVASAGLAGVTPAGRARRCSLGTP